MFDRFINQILRVLILFLWGIFHSLKHMYLVVFIQAISCLSAFSLAETVFELVMRSIKNISGMC